MADTRGTWSLSEAWGEKTADEWVPIPNVWVDDTTAVGYYAGGFVGGNVYIPYPTPSSIENATVVSKLTYSSSSIARAPSADLPDKNCDSGPFSSSTDGYMVGGSNNANGRNSYVRKLTYATDTTTTLPARHSQNVQGLAAMSYNDSKAYTMGGRGGPAQDGSWGNNGIRIYSLPTATNSPAPNLSNAVSHTTQTISSSSAGYVAGGVADFSSIPTYGYLRSFVQKITFSNNTNARSPSSDLIVPIKGSSAAGGSTDGYFMGGGTDDMTYAPTTSQIQKFTYSTDTTSLNPSNMLDENQKGSATGNSSSGFSAGGIDQNPIYTSAITKISFSTGTTSNSGAVLPQGNRNGIGAFSSVQSPLPSPRKRWFDNLGDGPDVGYVTGGYSSPASYHNRSSTEKINMATDTANAIVPGGQMPRSAAAQGASFGNHQYGITATLGTPAPDWSDGYNDCYRFTYSTETFSTVTAIGGIPSNYETGGRGFNDPTANNGYYAGGKRSGQSYAKSYVFKYSYSGDTWSTSPSLNQQRHWATNAQDNNNAWMLGGKGDIPGTGYTTLLSHSDKMSFSSGTWVLQPSVTFTGVTAGPSWQTRTHRMTYNACGDETAAYWASGFYWNDTAGCTNVWKLTYATGTIDNSGMYTTPSPNTFDLGGGLSNASKGYFAGGRYGAGNNTVNKFSYSTETISALSPGMTEGRMSAFTFGPRKLGSRLTAPEATPTSSTTLTGPQGIKAEGYLIQGIQGSTSGSGRSDSYKLDYTTDTWSSSANSTLTRKGAGATSTTTNAYIAGGTLTQVVGSNHGGDMDKYTYATSTFSRIPGSDAGGPTGIPGPSTANKQSAAGNQTQGYWAFGPAQSRCSKLTYSNETGSNLPNLPWNAKNSVGVSMQTHGYYGAGDGFDDKGSSFVKITFANDTYASYSGWTKQPGGPAPYRGASSSSTKAYIVGGGSLERVMDVTTWASNTTSNSPSTFLQSPGFSYAPGQGSNEAGYFTGGGNTGNNGTTTEKITYASDTTAIVPSAYFSSSSPSGINSYSTGGPNMNGLGTNSPNVI
jgi:hypothetical protein